MRAILTRSMWIFLLLRSMRDGIKSDRVIILDRARWERDGDWRLWQDEGECIG